MAKRNPLTRATVAKTLALNLRTSADEIVRILDDLSMKLTDPSTPT